MCAEERLQMPMLPAERKRAMLDLLRVVRTTGEYVRNLDRSRIRDTIEEAGHQFSTIDDEAGNTMLQEIEEVLGWPSERVIEESKIPRGVIDPARVAYPCLICDAVEGSTNAKRALAAAIRRRPILAGTSAVILEGAVLGQVAASAFYDFASGTVFASFRSEPHAFVATVNGKVVRDEDVLETRADSQLYVVVPAYSNDNTEARDEVIRALRAGGLWETGGTRSSAQDLVGILCNEVDAYVDLRVRYPRPASPLRRDEVLHFWDVGALLPVLEGFGFHITDAEGRSWMEREFGQPLDLVVARPSLGAKVRQAVRALSFVHGTAGEEPVITRLPPATFGR